MSEQDLINMVNDLQSLYQSGTDNLEYRENLNNQYRLVEQRVDEQYDPRTASHFMALLDEARFDAVKTLMGGSE